MTRRSWLIAGGLALVAGVLAIRGIVGRERALTALAHTAEQESILPVEVIAPRRGPSTFPLELPGTVRAWYEAPIFAQVSGYVEHWYEDYGAPVKAGQLLATVAAPGLDAEYAAAKADLGVSQANYRLAVSTATRWQALAGTPAVAKQEVDVQVAGAAARKAELEAARQHLARYAALEAFKRVVVPFDGVVTARLTDVGDYVNAGGGDAGARSNATELFAVADIHAMRVYVAVPQDYASMLTPGLTAMLHLPAEPGRPIPAKFLTTARAFNTSTRTAVTELVVDNPDGKLWPGTYVDVEFSVPTNPSILTMPEEALIFRAAGTLVAVLDGQNRVHLHHVTLGQNLGQTVQVTSGLAPGDRLINNPPAALIDGEQVRPVTPARSAAATEPMPPASGSGEYARSGTP